MKIVIIGGTGLIGSKLVTRLLQHGHEAVPAAPGTGVNTLTGEGLSRALDGADVVVDVSNSPSYAEGPAMDFFETSTRNLLAAEAAAGVAHHVALSVVGTERLSESAYFRAKIVQEYLVARSGIPWSIVRATQFFEFVGRIADEATVDGVARVSTGVMQPIAAADVSAAVARVAAGAPLDGTLEIGGPERIGMDELVRTGLVAKGDTRAVVSDPDAPYFGTRLSGDELSPGPDAQLSTTSFTDWLAVRSAAVK